MACITELNLVIVNVNPGRFLCLAFDNDLIVAGILHCRAECAAHVGIAMAMYIHTHD